MKCAYKHTRIVTCAVGFLQSGRARMWAATVRVNVWVKGPTFSCYIWMDVWVRVLLYMWVLCVSNSVSEQRLILAHSPLPESTSAEIYLWRLAHPPPPPYTAGLQRHTHTPLGQTWVWVQLYYKSMITRRSTKRSRWLAASSSNSGTIWCWR